MAIMIPRHPKEYVPSSREDEIFHTLERLPDDYYVFHSVSMLEVKDENTRSERQTDFIIFNPQKGLICLEAKNWRNIAYNNGSDGSTAGWYRNGVLCKNPNYDGPISQVNSFASSLIDILQQSRNQAVRDAVYHCKILPVVWFMPLSREQIDTMDLPLNTNTDLILSHEDVYLGQDPEKWHLEESLNKIFNTNIENMNNFRPLNEVESTAMIGAIAPKLTITFEKYAAETRQIAFNQLLKQQYAILDYLEEQPTAVISGMAGTGKTMLAVEKARRHAANNEPVLYLCFNSELQKQLKEDYQMNNLDILSVDGYCVQICDHGFDPQYKDAFYEDCINILNNIEPSAFPYKHIILDEGQDIRINPHLNTLFEQLKTIMELKEGTFYIFYDKMQLLPYTDRDHSGQLPAVITESDCKLTLYRNCRNTERIAKTSTVTIASKPPKMMEPTVEGDKPKFCYANNADEVRSKVRSIIRTLRGSGYVDSDIVILSLKGDSTKIQLDEQLLGQVKYTTANKFKGLESKAVIIVDFDAVSLTVNENQDYENNALFYVASSRAREKLYVIAAKMTDLEAQNLPAGLFKWNMRNPEVRVSRIRDRRSVEDALGVSADDDGNV